VTRIDPDELDGSLYRTLAGAVIPRPITWVSSLSRGGDENLAPYSFSTFENRFAIFEPIRTRRVLMTSSVRRRRS
jgi:hypothetical protein